MDNQLVGAVQNMPGFCGATIFSDFQYYRDAVDLEGIREDLEYDFGREEGEEVRILTVKEAELSTKRGVHLWATDRLNGAGWVYFTSPKSGWKKLSEFRNPNTNNLVALFEYSWPTK